MKRLSLWSLVVLVLSIRVATAQQQEVKYEELPNFRPVNDQLFRGGQPQENGMKKLSKLGIKTVINLRNDDARADAEEAEAQAAGLRYFNVPLPTYARPSDSKINDILSLINDPANQPVFVHCKRGSDRTGLVVAIYRISFDSWTSDQAVSEAKRYGLGFWQLRMKDYIGDYYKRRK